MGVVENQSKKRQRKLKVYASTTIVGAEVREALGLRSHVIQAKTIVAARSQREAAALFGTALSDLRHFGSETGNEFDIELAMTKPGQVFAAQREYGQSEYLEVTVSLAEPMTLKVGSNDQGLALADALLAKQETDRQEARGRREQHEAEVEARRTRNEETNRRAAEALDKLRPLLVEEGVHPDTLDVKGRGVWMVPEVAETVARLLTELQEVRAL